MKINLIREKLSTVDYEAILLTNFENEVAGKNLRYVTGFTGTSGAALIGPTFAYFISDFRYEQQVKNQVKGFDYVDRGSSIVNTLNELINKEGIKTLGFDQKILYSEYESYSNDLNVELVPMINFIEDLRIRKTDEEVQMLKAACVLADEAFAHIQGFIQPGMTEIEVATELEYFMKRKGASAPSFSFIVASGVRGAFPHGVASDKVINSGELVTMDYGCYLNGYASDITRTIAVGEVSDQLKEIYEVVREAQQRGVNAVRSGLTGKEVDQVCRDYITEKGYGQYFGHGTGHGLGLDVHEAPSVSVAGTNVLEEGMVITIEPGIYIEGVGGVRIEDDVVVTKDGCIVLTESPKELIIL